MTLNEWEQNNIEVLTSREMGEWLSRRENRLLDKIRAEIKEAVWEDVVVSLDGTDETRIPRLDPDDVFEIIDKYRKGESE